MENDRKLARHRSSWRKAVHKGKTGYVLSMKNSEMFVRFFMSVSLRMLAQISISPVRNVVTSA